MFFVTLPGGEAPPHNHPHGAEEQRLIRFLRILAEQVLNATIVGAIAGVSALVADSTRTGLKAAMLAFILTTLIELRKYRKL